MQDSIGVLISPRQLIMVVQDGLIDYQTQSFAHVKKIVLKLIRLDYQTIQKAVKSNFTINFIDKFNKKKNNNFINNEMKQNLKMSLKSYFIKKNFKIFSKMKMKNNLKDYNKQHQI